MGPITLDKIQLRGLFGAMGGSYWVSTETLNNLFVHRAF